VKIILLQLIKVLKRLENLLTSDARRTNQLLAQQNNILVELVSWLKWGVNGEPGPDMEEDNELVSYDKIDEEKQGYDSLNEQLAELGLPSKRPSSLVSR